MTALVPFENLIVSKEDVEALLPEPTLTNLAFLFQQHGEQIARANLIHQQVTDPLSMAVMSHYFEAAKDLFNRYAPEPSKVFDLVAVRKHIDAVFWDKALKSTSIYDVMPAKRKNEWYESIKACSTPPFEEATVQNTIDQLYQNLPNFMAERVDGIYRALSRSHLTNKPEGFSARGIFPYGYERPYGWVTQSAMHTLEDLANMIAVLNGTPLYLHHHLHDAVKGSIRTYGTGQWFDVLGLFRMRVYLKGTVHIEVSEDYSWQLNTILGMANPGTIPEKYRRPVKAAKHRQFSYSQNTLDRETHSLFQRLDAARPVIENGTFTYALSVSQQLTDKHHRKIFTNSIEAIGGKTTTNAVIFDYDATSVLRRIVDTAKIPERTTHQFYPTPANIAEIAVAMAGIQDSHAVLEPSAGQGGLADVISQNHPNAKLQCVEISPLNASILRAKGHSTIEDDFLRFAENTTERFHRCVLNPPYSLGRHKSHLSAAAKLLTPDGVLVAILPTSCMHIDPPIGLLPADNQYDTTTYEFPNTSIKVCIRVFRKA